MCNDVCLVFIRIVSFVLVLCVMKLKFSFSSVCRQSLVSCVQVRSVKALPSSGHL